ncbi:pyruvate kinase [Chitinivibrio alkaliphilus]|uniref:Pyruvate kinase n=1 Tax=Chitinivibrio alkaliphilus ACht1 TaxID=1313304 RepID=U7D8Z8_9BACT|nr:pyruvate kinase [Chitinivibrio alkaliphilus]ERP31577.1 pyruvate kinase [Chitinivibrio alkaliphilus ACht1]
MRTLDMLPETPRKKTKIVATISDKNCSTEFITELYKNGLNVVRINTAHQTPEVSKEVIDNVRKVSEKIAIMIDTKGPEVRTTAADEEIPVETGDTVYFAGRPNTPFSGDTVNVSYTHFVEEIPVGSHILIDDGELTFVVNSREGDRLSCVALNQGVVRGKKSVNVPNVHLHLPTLTEKDKQFLRFAVEEEVDFIAHSFVRNKQDLLNVKSYLAGQKNCCRIISKIENQEGVDNIDEILDHSYGIMIARGDLAVEIPRERIPSIQKKLIKKCITKRKPVIIATQMLHSMLSNPSPTRAEVSDVANAIYDEADAVMLSGETANGKYPVESIRVMCDIAVEVEKDLQPFSDIHPITLNTEVSAYLCKSAIESANRLNAKAIIADTASGRTVRNLAGYRGNTPIYALCYNDHIVRSLALSFGVTPYFFDGSTQPVTDRALKNAMKRLAYHFNFAEDDYLVILSGNYGAQVGASYIGITTTAELENDVFIRRD